MRRRWGCWWRQRRRRVRVDKGGQGRCAVATARRRGAVRARRWHRRGRRRWRRRRRRGRLAVAIALDHVLDVHEAALVRILVDCRRRRCDEGVRTIWARGQRHHLGTLKKTTAIDNGAVRGVALPMHLFAVGERVQDKLVVLIVVGVLDLDRQVALPLLRRRGLRRRRRFRWRRLRGRRRQGRRRRVASLRRGRQWRRRQSWRKRWHQGRRWH